MKWNELQNFTWNEVSFFTYDQLNRLTSEELKIILGSLLETVSRKKPELEKPLQALAENLLASAIYDGVKHLILLVQSLL